MKILITGGSGFIGRNLVESFSADYEICAPSHRELDLYDEDKVRRYLKRNNFDVVIHTAVKPGHRNSSDQSGQFYNNARMVFSMARNEHLYKKMIVMGPGLDYDIRHYKPRMKEEYFDQHLPEDESSLAKYLAAKFVQKSDNMIELRIFGIFSKYEDYAIRFISNLICKAIYDLPLTMNQNRRFSYVYIDDFVPIVRHFIENGTEEKALNITSGKVYELYELAKIIKKISGKDLPIMVDKKGMGVEYSGSNSRLKKCYPEVKFRPIEQAISELYQWYSRNKKKIKRDYLLVDKF